MIGMSARAAAPPSPRPAPAPLVLWCRTGSRLFAFHLLLEPFPGHLVHAEGGVELADDVVGRHVPVLELLEVGHHLRLDESADGIPHHQLLFGPFEHGGPPDARYLQRSVDLRLTEVGIQSGSAIEARA
jgi:hypothetical protein